MKFKEELAKKLGVKDQKLIKELPSGYQRVGDIVILRLKPNLLGLKEKIGKAVKEIVPNIKTVCILRRITGISRKPEIEVIYGNKTVTIVKEKGCLFELDVKKIMFSKGNAYERHRIAELIKKGEVVVDMFAGIGYFSIPVAKTDRHSAIYSMDINKDAIFYLKRNIRHNKVRRVYPILGDCRIVCNSLLGVADRVIMGYIKCTYDYLDAAFAFLKRKGIIHYHDTYRKNEIWQKPLKILRKKAKEAKVRLKILRKRIVKSYAPNVYHVVIDLKVSKF